MNSIIVSYGLDPAFEHALLVGLATRPALYARIGRYLDPDMMADGYASEAARAIKSIATNHRPPRSIVVVAQQLRAWVEDGTCSSRALKYWAEICGSAEILTDDAIVAQVQPSIRRVMAQEALELQLNNYGKGDPESATKTIDRAEKLLAEARKVGDHACSESADFYDVEAIGDIREKLPTGNEDLDDIAKGGVPIGEACCYTAITGSGKSMILGQFGATAAALGRSVAYISWELPYQDILPRMWAALLNWRIDSVIEHKHKALKLISQLDLAPIRVVNMTKHVSTVQDAGEWLRETEETVFKGKRQFDLVILDYLDRVGTGTENLYLGGRNVSDDADSLSKGVGPFSDRDPCWVWTASQTKTREEGRSGKDYTRQKKGDDKWPRVEEFRPYVPDLGDLAESSWKSKGLGVLLFASVHTLKRRRGIADFWWGRFAKTRGFRANNSSLIGPLESHRERGRVIPSTILPETAKMPRRGIR